MQVYHGQWTDAAAGQPGYIPWGPGMRFAETQLFPNGIHRYGFPSPILRAGESMHSETVFSFGLC